MPRFLSHPDESEPWRVGARYAVAYSCDLHVDMQLRGDEVWSLNTNDQVLLVAMSEDTPLTGFVLPSVSNGRPGWINLHGGYIHRKALENSWEIQARYSANHPCTIRAGKSLNSPILSEIMANEEVLVLELGAADDRGNGEVLSTHIPPLSSQPRLRACVVVVDSGTVGWLSPEPMANVRLLEPVNLLGPKVVEMHRKATFSLYSMKYGQALAWQVGCKYRVLENQQLRSEPDLDSQTLLWVQACAIVEVLETAAVKCPDLGTCPAVLVYLCEGSNAGAEGWLRCVGKEGHDIIDTRDLLMFHKIMKEKARGLPRQINDGVHFENEPREKLVEEAENEQVLFSGFFPNGGHSFSTDFLGGDDDDWLPFVFPQSDDKRQFQDSSMIEEDDFRCFDCSCQRACDRN